MPIDQEELHRLLSYDKETGHFTWNVNQRRARAGNIAGFLNDEGYWDISLFDKPYRAARLAWFYVTGEWPPKHMDHVDGNRANNAWTNLRLATPNQNMHNKALQANNSSGFKGVYWYKPKRRWRAIIGINNKRIHLGTFKDPSLAYAAYCAAAAKYHGEFANIGGSHG